MNILMFAQTVSKSGPCQGVTCNHILGSIIINTTHEMSIGGAPDEARKESYIRFSYAYLTFLNYAYIRLRLKQINIFKSTI